MTFIDARSLDGNGIISADLCVVGSGAAGLAIAKELIGQRIRVVVLESGDLNYSSRTQALYDGENVGRESISTTRSRFRVFGGSTTRWGGQCRPLDAVDFEAREGIPHSGWPFARDRLEPYYRRAHAFCNLGPYDYAPSSSSNRDGRMLPIDSGELESKIFQFSFPANLGNVYRDEIASTSEIVVYLNTNVVEIDVDEYGKSVTGMRAATFNGKNLHISADCYVLACGGIENARLLLASDKSMKGGIGNQHDLVGRFFMDHAYFLSGHFEPAEACFDETPYVIEDYARVGSEQKWNAAFALKADILREERLNSGALYFVRRPNYKTRAEYFSPGGKSFIRLVDVLRQTETPDRRLVNHIGNSIVGIKDVGTSLARRLKEFIQPQLRLALRSVIETTPHPDSRVTLGSRCDRFGMPRVRVNWLLNDDDKRGFERLMATLGKEFLRLGFGRLVEDRSVDANGWPNSLTAGKHHMGTTRMHSNPRNGVVDADCRVHGILNLYIAGSSVFPTGGYANPTLTIVALAIRLADHLKERLRGS